MLKKKLEIIQQHDALDNKNQRNASKSLNSKLMDLKANNISNSCKRQRSGNDPEIETNLLECFKFAKDKGAPISGKSQNKKPRK